MLQLPRQEISTNRYYRKTFDANELPDIYTAMYYFKKHPDVKAYFIIPESQLLIIGNIFIKNMQTIRCKTGAV